MSRPPIIADDFSEMSSDSEMSSPEHLGMVYCINVGLMGIAIFVSSMDIFRDRSGCCAYEIVLWLVIIGGSSVD